MMRKIYSSLLLIAMSVTAKAQVPEAVLRALQERKQVVASRELSASESYRKIYKIRYPDADEPPLAEPGELIQWKGLEQLYPEKGQIPNLDTLLKVLNQASQEFDAIKEAFVAYDVDNKEIINQHFMSIPGTPSPVYDPMTQTYINKITSTGDAHIQYTPISLPSVGIFTEANWRAKLKILASNINQLRALRWKVAALTGYGHTPVPDDGYALPVLARTIIGQQADPATVTGWQQTEMPYPWLFTWLPQTPCADGPGAHDNADWSIQTDQRLKSFWRGGGGYRQNDIDHGQLETEFGTINGIAANKTLEENPPHFKSRNWDIVLFKSYSVSVWNDLIEGQEAHEGGENIGYAKKLKELVEPTYGNLGIAATDKSCIKPGWFESIKWLSGQAIISSELTETSLSPSSKISWENPTNAPSGVNSKSGVFPGGIICVFKAQSNGGEISNPQNRKSQDLISIDDMPVPPFMRH